MNSQLFIRFTLGASFAFLHQATAQTIEVTSTGVGIGTASPASKLDILGSGTASLFKAAHSGSGASLLFEGTSSTAARFTVDANVFRVMGFGNTALYAETYSGNVGIGTSSPAAKLEVKGDELRIRSIVAKTDVTGRGLLRLTSDDTVGTNNLEMLFTLQGGTTGGGRYGQVQVADYGYSWGNFVVNPSGGNVGIGTTNPTRRLEVAGSITSSVAGGGTLELNGSNSNSQPSIYFERSGAGVWSTGLTADASASLYINNGYGGGNVITMTPAGNVGIGTTTPGYKLEVAGSVRATSFIANSNTYADFVFKPGYPLRSLSEVEAAIKAHGHLPDIPSEAEAKARGIDLAAMQVKLLQKVEELTLYLLAHDKELRAQNQEVRQLRTENAALRDEVLELKKR